MLCACGADPYRPAAIPTPAEEIAVYRDLPDDLVRPCERRPPGYTPTEIKTDVDLMGLASWLMTALDRCADQVDGVRQVYRLTRAQNTTTTTNP
jgi:hypothetical protein